GFDVVASAGLPGAPDLPSGVAASTPEDAGRALAAACDAHAHQASLGPASLELGLLAVVRRRGGPFGPLELAQLRVLADFAARARLAPPAPPRRPPAAASRGACGRGRRGGSATAAASPTACSTRRRPSAAGSPWPCTTGRSRPSPASA